MPDRPPPSPSPSPSPSQSASQSQSPLELMRERARRRQRERGIGPSQARREIAAEYGFASWVALERQTKSAGLTGMERALVLADTAAVAARLRTDPAAATTPLDGLAPLLFLLRRSTGTPPEVLGCVQLLLGGGADVDSHTIEWEDGWDVEQRQTALYDAVARGDLGVARSLALGGAAADENAFYHACEQGDPGFLEVIYRPGFERYVGHKLDFEDATGLRWFLDRGVDVNEHGCLHHAVARGRGLTIIKMLLDAGADVNRPWHRWDAGRRPLALAARCGHLAAYELLAARGATADLDPVDTAVLAVARGESVRLPRAVPPALGNPQGEDYGWILGQFALLDRTGIVRNLLDAGMGVDTRGWSNFTPLDQAAMHGRTATVRLLVERGADLDDYAFDEDGPTPLDCALWGIGANRADDGDYAGTVEALLAAGAPTRHTGRTGDAAVDALLDRYGVSP